MPHDPGYPIDLLSIDYRALTMEQRDAFRREAIRRAEAARNAFLRAAFAGLARFVRGSFTRLAGRKPVQPVRIPGRTIAQV
jgi:hypothetical protein